MPKLLLVSGGEPTDHPLFIEMMYQLKKEFKGLILLTSNGMFLEDEKLTKQIIDLNVKVQITNDVRFYPKRIKNIKHENFIYIDKLIMLAPFGRALKNNLKCERVSPYCFNARSVHSQEGNFSNMLEYMETQLTKYCVPMLDINGDISLGEMGICYKIGNIYCPEYMLSKNIKNMHCNKCGLYNNLSNLYRNAVGENQ